MTPRNKSLLTSRLAWLRRRLTVGANQQEERRIREALDDMKKSQLQAIARNVYRQQLIQAAALRIGARACASTNSCASASIIFLESGPVLMTLSSVFVSSKRFMRTAHSTTSPLP